MRIKASEITLQRILSAVRRRLENLPLALKWQFAEEEKRKLAAFKDIHLGQRCFVVANGPSLKHMDLSLLKDEITIGMNRIYLLFDDHFETTYHTAINELVLEQFHTDIAKLRPTKFLNWKQHKLFRESEDVNYLFISQSLVDGFSKDLTKNLYSGGTVTYTSLQLAFYMGFHEVILIGLDHNFTDKGVPNKTEVRKGDDHNHFHPDYFPKGIKWQLPDLHRSELAYQVARDTFEKAGRRIIDATVDGKCEVFEKVAYDSLFK